MSFETTSFIHKMPFYANVPAWRQWWIYMGNKFVPFIDLYSPSYLVKIKYFIWTWIFKEIPYLKLHPSSTKCLFGQISRRDGDDEFIWEAIYFFSLTSIHTHIHTKVSYLSGIQYSKICAIWNCIFHPLNPFLGKCPGVTQMMNLYGKQYCPCYWPCSEHTTLQGSRNIWAWGDSCRTQIHHQTTYSSFASRRDTIS